MERERTDAEVASAEALIMGGTGILSELVRREIVLPAVDENGFALNPPKTTPTDSRLYIAE